MLPESSESTVLPTNGDDLGVLAAADHAEFHDAGDLLAEADAARALDAARHLLGRDQRTQILVEHHALRLGVARTRTPP